MADLASTIRHARADAGLTQADLAARAGTSQPALARYEAGTNLPTLPTLERLLSACGRQLEIQTPPATQPFASATSIRGQLGPQAGELRRRRRRLLDAADKHGVNKLRVFGSLARGEAKASSDIDLLVDLKPGRTLVDLAAFRREATEILDMPVDVATVGHAQETHPRRGADEALPI